MWKSGASFIKLYCTSHFSCVCNYALAFMIRNSAGLTCFSDWIIKKFSSASLFPPDFTVDTIFLLPSCLIIKARLIQE